MNTLAVLGSDQPELSQKDFIYINTGNINIYPDTVYEVIPSSGQVSKGSYGLVSYCYDDEKLFGYVIKKDTGDLSLSDLSYKIYTDIFQLLKPTGFTSIWRAWNYIPRINQVDGTERYLQFNEGRSLAFDTSRQAYTSNAPAACGVGTSRNEVVVCFLAGRSSSILLDNDRQVCAYEYPATYGKNPPIFSRAAIVPRSTSNILFISGTASIVGHLTTYENDVKGQTHETIKNLLVLITKAQVNKYSLGYKIYIRNYQDIPAVKEVVTQWLPGHYDVIYVIADLCRTSLLVEIEATSTNFMRHLRYDHLT